MSNRIGLGHIIGGRTSRTDIPPLTFPSIQAGIDDVVSYMGVLTVSYNQLGAAGTDLQRVIGLEIASGSTAAADGGGFIQGQIEAGVGRMRQFGCAPSSSRPPGGAPNQHVCLS